jgi:hypothetical protein
MSGEPTINELEKKRIAVVRQNLSGLVEQAAVSSGAGDEARAADRIAEQSRSLPGWGRPWGRTSGRHGDVRCCAVSRQGTPRRGALVRHNPRLNRIVPFQTRP